MNLAPEEVLWESSSQGTGWLANELRLSKGGFLYFWRSHLDPIWNHYIRGPVRIWSVDDGPDERALTALEARDLGSAHPAYFARLSERIFGIDKELRDHEFRSRSATAPGRRPVRTLPPLCATNAIVCLNAYGAPSWAICMRSPPSAGAALPVTDKPNES